MARSVLFVEHIEYETGGHAMTLLSHLPTREAVFETRLPPLDEIAGIVITGGQMSAAEVDRFPSLQAAADLALRAIDADIPVLGLCLGHQIIGRALGGEHREGAVDAVGIIDIELVAPDPWLGDHVGTIGAMRWNSDVVSLPPGATLLARSDTVDNDAFRYGSAVGMQFHLEADDRVMRLWDSVASPTLSELRSADAVAGWREHLATDETLLGVVERGFGAFAEACAARL
ncbi:type 1 glutamine amidotransferase [Agrococcus carbonis]|uniref:GMP synthase (Glutamine-hydrolysing) n=1 Tax=Agrococcus carbonis TaxID=684552 RepID=A0A1H1MVR9_9MICO|nr:type 1 glutamine amidotransferase [Agrococcus carbonis]SDR90728.1 GMP synthase (glutamine-hydrolysing) [Agrococcus carbonis]